VALNPLATQRFFGEPWGGPRNPISNDLAQVDTPVGQKCSGTCGQLIEDGQRGFTLPGIDAAGQVTWVAFHLRCMVHDTAGCVVAEQVAGMYGPSAGPDPHHGLAHVRPVR
jgi:hypothetical protein